VQLWQQIWDEHGDAELTNFRVYGMSNAWIMVQALMASCDNLNREAIVATIEEQGSDWEGPWLSPLEYSEDSHRGITGLQMTEITPEGFEPKGDVLVTDSEDGRSSRTPRHRQSRPRTACPEV
jgi:hypothetical protein